MVADVPGGDSGAPDVRVKGGVLTTEARATGAPSDGGNPVYR